MPCHDDQSEVFANTECLQSWAATTSAVAMDDVAALVADAQVRGRIWHEDQADLRASSGWMMAVSALSGIGNDINA